MPYSSVIPFLSTIAFIMTCKWYDIPFINDYVNDTYPFISMENLLSRINGS